MQEFLDYLLPVSIGVIMLGIGMGLSVGDFKRVFVEPKAVLFGLFGQLVLMVLVAFAIAIVFPLEPVHQIGILLIASCPGGTSSNIVSYMLKGRVALSVSITAFNSLLVVFTIPLILKITFSMFWNTEDVQDVEISFSTTFREILLTVLLPVLLGVFIRHRFPDFSEKLKKPLRFILPTILFVVFSLVLLLEQQNTAHSLTDYAYLLLPALMLNVAVMFVGFYSSGWVGINHEGKYTIAIEMGLQNSALAIYLANNVLQIEGLAIIAVLYGSFSFFTTLLIAYIMKNYFGRKTAKS